MAGERKITLERAGIGDLPRLENVFGAMLDEIAPLGQLDRAEARRQFEAALTDGEAQVLWCGDIPAGFDAWQLFTTGRVAEEGDLPAVEAVVAAEVAIWVHPSWRRERRATCLRNKNLRAIAQRLAGQRYTLLTSTNPRNAAMCGFLAAQGAQAAALIWREQPKAEHQI